MARVNNYARFYVLLNAIQTVDKECLKAELVSQYTNGRTTSLKGMKRHEYDTMCNAMEHGSNYEGDMKRKRSAVLKRMQAMGVDTTSWQKVDEFCMNARIAGKRFCTLSMAELDTMLKKLIAIGKKPRKPKPEPEREVGAEVKNDDIYFMLQAYEPIQNNQYLN